MNLKQASVLFCRVALLVIYFWFGLLKVVGQSPASPMIQNLFDKTMGYMPFWIFIIIFGLFEMLIGLLFIIPGKERVAIVLFFIHMVMTVLPLFILRGEVWSYMFVPTLEGQYIIKNLALIACALTIVSIVPSKNQQNSVIL